MPEKSSKLKRPRNKTFVIPTFPEIDTEKFQEVLQSHANRCIKENLPRI